MSVNWYFISVCFFSSRRRHTRCALVTGVQTCVLPICDPCMGDRPSTHGAGFQRDPQIATGQAEIAKGCRRLTNGDDFRMSGGVLIAAIAIFPFTDNDAVLGYEIGRAHV